MRVLFLTKHYPPSEGGIERYGHMLCTELKRRKIHVEVIAASEEHQVSREEMVDDVRVHRLDYQLKLSSTPITCGLLSLLPRLAPDFDLIHLNFPNPWTDVLYLSLCGKMKSVLTYHSDIFRQSGTLSGAFLKSYQPLIHHLLKRVSAIIATSPNCVDTSPFLSRNRERCHIIPMPVDLTSLEITPEDCVGSAAKKYGTFVLFVGRLVYYKGVRHLIDAMTHINGVNLVVVGRGPLERELREQANKLEIDDRVFFLGKVPDDALRLLYHGCRCCVLPSVAHAEGFGMVLAEAMSCAKPVISTELATGTSYVNIEGVTGFVVPPGDAISLAERISRLINDEVLYERLGSQGRSRVLKNFTKDIVVDKTVDIYRNVLESD